MPFSDILKQVVHGTEGALGALIVGLDGIPEKEYALENDVDIQSMTVEYSALLKEIEKGSQAVHLDDQGGYGHRGKGYGHAAPPER